MAHIELKQVTFTYPLAKTGALRDVSLEVEKGEFVVLFGASGSGKSTLLRLLKKEIQPHGMLHGEILIDGQDQKIKESYSNHIGFVFQDPENQVVADDVLHEMVFGLENLGVEANEMRSRVAEIVHYFGMEKFLHRKTDELSGGMKQQLNLASVLLMQPDVLLLDEPTAQLDPVSAREFLDILVRLNEEFGMTIILAEHRLDDVFTIADKIVMMESGTIKLAGNPKNVLEAIWESDGQPFVPSIPALYFSTTEKEERVKAPLSVKEGRNWISKTLITDGPLIEHNSSQIGEVSPSKIMEARGLYYRYGREEDFVLKDLNFSIAKGEIYTLLGGNGAGKSTFLKLLTGVLKPSKGTIYFDRRPYKSLKSFEISKLIGYLPQNPKTFFIQETVEKELRDTMEKWGISDPVEVQSLIESLGLTTLLNKHPYDLSGGEIQKAALACVLVRKPEILILDEPTKGLDPKSKESFANILHDLKKQGITILMATHDIEFAAKHATKCGMLFEGNITSEAMPKGFFTGNFFYTTMVQRLFRHLPKHRVVTLEEAVSLCRLEKL